LNDLWKYEVILGRWTWLAGSNDINTLGSYRGNAYPGSRSNHRSCYFATSNEIYMFGGYGYSQSSEGFLNDLWKLNLATNRWTYLKGSSMIDAVGEYGTQGVLAPSNSPGARSRFDLAIHDVSGSLFLFGGNGRISGNEGISNLNIF
jgi:hypothetical protein